MDSIQSNQPAPVTFAPLPSTPATFSPSADRVREQLGWRLLQQNWLPDR